MKHIHSANMHYALHDDYKFLDVHHNPIQIQDLQELYIQIDSRGEIILLYTQPYIYFPLQLFFCLSAYCKTCSKSMSPELYESPFLLEASHSIDS